MTIRPTHPSLRRCLGVWLVGLAAAAALIWLGWAPVLSSHGQNAPVFTSTLVLGCGLACLGCGGWLAITVTVVTYQVARGRSSGRIRGCPDSVRRLLVLACGAALAGSLTAPALAHDAGPRAPKAPPAVTALMGLAVPDRAADPPGRGRRPTTTPATPVGRPTSGTGAPASAQRTITVAPGDSLWLIAARDLPEGASPAQITARWRAIYQDNQAAIGADPDLIEPGLHLSLRPRGEE